MQGIGAAAQPPQPEIPLPGVAAAAPLAVSVAQATPGLVAGSLRALPELGERLRRGVVDKAADLTGMNPKQRAAAHAATKIAQTVVGTAAPGLAPGARAELGQQADERLARPLEEKIAATETAQRLARKRANQPFGEAVKDPERWMDWGGSAAPSMALMAATAGAGLPLLPGTMLMEGGGKLREIEEKEKATGKRYGDLSAATVATVTGVVNGYLEKFGFESAVGKLAGFLPAAAKKGFLGNVSRIVQGAIGEGGTEAAQQLIPNALTKVFLDSTQDLGEGVVDSIMGGIVGGGGAAGIHAGQRQVRGSEIEQRRADRRAWRAEDATRPPVAPIPFAGDPEGRAGASPETVQAINEGVRQVMGTAPETMETRRREKAETLVGELLRLRREEAAAKAAREKPISVDTLLGAQALPGVVKETVFRDQTAEARGRNVRNAIDNEERQRIATTPGAALRLILGDDPAFIPAPAPAPVAETPGGPAEKPQRISTPILDWIERTAGDIDEDRRSVTPEEWGHDEARYFALTDSGTGLPNRQAYAIAQKQTPNAVHAVLDVDGLKKINDTFGHEIGDEYLSMVALAARHNGVRLFRVGGDEFTALHEGDEAGITKMLEATRTGLEATRVSGTDEEGGEYPLHQGFSYGTGPDFKAADARAYEDKRRRKARGPAGADQAARPEPVGVGRSEGAEAAPGPGDSAGVPPPVRKRDGGTGGDQGAPPAGPASLPPPVTPAAPAAAAKRSPSQEAAAGTAEDPVPPAQGTPVIVTFRGIDGRDEQRIGQFGLRTVEWVSGIGGGGDRRPQWRVTPVRGTRSFATAHGGVSPSRVRVATPEEIARFERDGGEWTSALPGEPEPTVERPAPAPPAPNPAPTQDTFRHQGKEGEAFTADGERVGVRWAVADAFDDVVPSHDETGAGELVPNPSFAQVLQPRDRGRAASEQQVERISRALRPAALGESHNASDGAPIVGPDRLVESGNGRTLAVRRAYRTGRGEEYRRWLEEHAADFGLTAEQVRDLKAPMLVRVRTTPTADRAELVKKFNVATVARMSAAETARADADRLTPALLSRFQPGEDALSILAVRNRDFVAGFLETVPETDRAELLDEDGQLNQAGRKRIENALLGKAYGRASILERITESTDDNTRLVSGALLNAAPAMAAVKGSIEKGDVHAELDPTPAIVEAVEKLSWLRDEGGSVESYLQQTGLFGDEMTPAGREVLQAFDGFKRSGRKLTSFLTNLSEGLILNGDARQGGLFAGSEVPPLEDFVRAARRYAADGGQATLALGGEDLPEPRPGESGTSGPRPGGSPGPVDRPRVSRAHGLPSDRSAARNVLFVERWARQFSDGWKDAPALTVVENEEGLPDELRALAGDSRVEGVYVPREDRVYLVAGSLKSREDVERVVLHEVMGHAGLRRLIGREAFGGLMDDIARSLPKDVEAKARAYGLDLDDQEQRREAADEVLAEWASRPEAPPRAITRAMVAIRGLLRKLFPSLKWTPDDVRALLARARERVEQGEGVERGDGARFARTDLEWVNRDIKNGKAEALGADFALYFDKDADGFPFVSAIRRDTGATVGEASFVYERVPNADETGLENGRLKGWDVTVRPEFRRRGIARAMYDLAARREGKEIVPGDFQTPDGRGFLGAGAARFSKAQEKTPAFRDWFWKSKVVDAEGKPKVVYHGAKRPDRIGSVFRRSRATSGPMAFFTSDPEIASKYATGKADTSLEPPSDYAGWFKVKVGRTEVDVDRAWYSLPSEKRAEVARKIPHVVWDNEDGQDSFRLGGPDEYGLAGADHWDYTLRREARGNPLRAAVEIWLNSAGLFDQEERFLEVLRLAGLDGVTYASPWEEHPGVLPVYLSIQRPLDTGAIPSEVATALEKASRRQGPAKAVDGDQWNKRAQDPRVWIERFRKGLNDGSTHAWTSVPDWVTKTLKGLGYDGIKDTGGKNGGDPHEVWIPFEETQVKSATGNRGTFDPTKKDIRFSRTSGPSSAEDRIYDSLVRNGRRKASAAAEAIDRVRSELQDPGDVMETRPPEGLPTHSEEIQGHIRPAGRKATLERLLNPFESAYQQLIRRHYAVEKAGKILGAADRPAHLDPGVVAELAAGHAARAEQLLMGRGGFRYDQNGDIEWTGTRSLAAILGDLGPGRLNEVRRYLVARRAIELHHRTGPQKGLMGDQEQTIYSGISEAAAQQEVAGAPEDVKEAAKEITALLDDALRYWADAGGLSPEAVDVIRDLNRAYVPFYRVLEGQDPAKRSGRLILPAQRGAALQAEQAVKTITGGGAPILDPLVAVADHIHRMIRAADLNRVGRSLVEAAALNPEAALGLVEEVKRVPGPDSVPAEGKVVQDSAGAYGVEVTDEAAEAVSMLSDRKLSFAEDRIKVWRNGKMSEWRVARDIGEALRALGPEDSSLTARALSFPARMLRGGVTKNPVFALHNVIRDTLDAGVQSRNGFIPVLDSIRGFREAVRNGDLRQEWLAAGGGYATISGQGVKAAERTLRDIAPRTAGQSILRTVAHPLEALAALNAPFEEAARLGEFRRARLAGKSATEAALDSARVTTNFTVHGADPKFWWLARASAFTNPAIQGADRAFRTVFEAKRGEQLSAGLVGKAAAAAAVKGLLTVGTLAAVLYALNWDDDEINELRRTKQGAVWWFVRLSDNVIFRIPKPFLWGQVYGTGVEAALDRARGQNPAAAKEWRREVLEMLTDNVVPVPTIGKLAFELGANKSLFFKTPIVPRGLEQLEPRYQAKPSTGEVARRAGDAVNLSPAKIEHTVSSLTGTLGREGLRAGDTLLRGDKASPPSPRIGDYPVVGRVFARTPDLSTDATETFYEDLDKVRQAVATMKHLGKQDPEEARRRRPEFRRALLAAKQYESAAETLSEMRKQIERYRSAPDTRLSREEKRRKIDSIVTRMNLYARRVVDRRLLEERER